MTSESASHHQLTLNVRLRDDATFENFLVTQGRSVLLEALLCNGREPYVYLYGPAGSGKSHLLQAACHDAGQSAVYLPLSEVGDFSPAEVLDGMEAMSLVCLDDLHAVLGKVEWEEQLFHFFNRAREAGTRLLVGAEAAPRALSIDLPDLASRLSWGVVYKLDACDDEARKRILTFRAARRGLQMPDEVATFIVNRSSREMNDLLQVLDTLDAASLTQQRALSIPFVKSQLGW